MKEISNWRYILSLFLGWRLILIFITLYGLSTFANVEPISQHLSWPSGNLNYFDKWANWDGGHFLGIAEHGYKMQQTVFFPFYIMLISLLFRLGIPSLWAGLLISHISTLIALFLLYKLCLLDFGKPIAKKVILSLLIFPTSFYLVSVYSESLFLALTLASFYFARKNNFLLASTFAGLSSVTRLAGVAVIAGIFVEYFLDRNLNKIKSINFIYLLLSFLPLLFYMYYQNNLFGNPLSFISSESSWNRHISMPWDAPIGYFRYILSSLLSPFGNFSRTFSEFMFFLLFVFCLIYSFTKLRFSYTIFFLISLLLPLFSGTLIAIQRYGLTIFPIFFILANIKNEVLVTLGIILSISMLAIYSTQFINWYWVT